MRPFEVNRLKKKKKKKSKKSDVIQLIVQNFLKRVLIENYALFRSLITIWRYQRIPCERNASISQTERANYFSRDIKSKSLSPGINFLKSNSTNASLSLEQLRRKHIDHPCTTLEASAFRSIVNLHFI